MSFCFVSGKALAAVFVAFDFYANLPTASALSLTRKGVLKNTSASEPQSKNPVRAFCDASKHEIDAFYLLKTDSLSVVFPSIKDSRYENEKPTKISGQGARERYFGRANFPGVKRSGSVTAVTAA